MASYLQSDLSNPSYTYDVVVAVTQKSINATMLEYVWAQGLDSETTTACYIADSNGLPIEIDYQELIKNANGTDPFVVAPNAEPGCKELNDLQGARFMYGFQMALGTPPGYRPADLPDMVSLENQSSYVDFQLLCKTFQIVQFTPASGYAPPTWMNISQPPGNAWIYSCKVNMQMTALANPGYANLPQAIKDQIQNLDDQAFSIQQLLFDLENAGLQSSAKIEGVVSGTPLYNLLNTVFIQKYMGAMQAKGQPILSTAICPASPRTSSLNLTSLNFESGNLNGDSTTLDYLCASDNKPLHVAVPFSWDWINSTESTQFDGVVAINRNTIYNWIWDQLQPQSARYCLVPSAHCWLDSGSIPQYSGGFSQAPFPPAWTLDCPPTGSTMLNITYSADAYDQAGWKGCLGHLELSTNYSVTVTFVGTTIIIKQQLVQYIDLMKSQSTAKGNYFDQTITDTYSLAVTEDGSLTATLESVPHDDSQRPDVNAFIDLFTGINELVQGFEGYKPTNLEDIPIAFIQSFVFPGSNTFAFKDVTFSDNQDLVAHITYCDPVASSAVSALRN